MPNLLKFWGGGKMGDKLAADAEIPRLQRRTSAPPLARFAAMPVRNTALVEACVTGCYGMTEIAQAFEIHYATVSRIVKMTDNFWEMGDPAAHPLFAKAVPRCECLDWFARHCHSIQRSVLIRMAERHAANHGLLRRQPQLISNNRLVSDEGNLWAGR